MAKRDQFGRPIISYPGGVEVTTHQLGIVAAIRWLIQKVQELHEIEAGATDPIVLSPVAYGRN